MKKCRCESITFTRSLSLSHTHTRAHKIKDYIMASDSPWNITNKDFSHYFAFYHEIVPDGELLSGNMSNTYHVYSYDLSLMCMLYSWFYC